VTKRDKDLNRILDGRYDRSIDFALLLKVLTRLGYHIRQEGSHHIARKSGVPGRLVIQPRGGLAKEYQVRQIRRVILTYEEIEPSDEV
jgi:predicted RNA binding protein YcfA (HicA-like mRNA interferase family)